MNLSLSFLGGVGTVTGSKYLVEHEKHPVLVDDIISTGRTMLEAIRQLNARGHAAPVCVAVHGLFAADAYEALIHDGLAS